MPREEDVYPLVYEELEKKGWNTKDPSQVAKKVKINGREADIVLYDNKKEPLAVIELKKEGVDPYSAKMQAKEYADKLSAPFVFLTDGIEIYFWELNTGFDAHLVRAFLTQEDLTRKRYLLKNRKDFDLVAIDKKIVGGVKNRRDWNFQVECVHAICDGLKRHKRRMLIEMATGTGKTRTIAATIKRLMEAGWVNNVLFVVDRETLAHQGLGVFNRFIGDYGYVFEKGDILPEKRITISIINTMANHYERFSPGYFDLIVTDECHRSIYHKWRDALLYFDGIHVGLTATPANFIDRNTYRFFHCEEGKPTFSFPLVRGIEKGVLVPYEIYKATTQITREGLHWDGEDYSPSDLEKKITVPERNEKMVKEFKSKAKFAKTLVFAATKKHASSLCRIFNKAYSRHGDNVAIDITTDTRRPDQAIKEFKENPMPMIAVSVGMLDTGFDFDEAENLVFARPIRSPILYQQMRGRGTRTCDKIGKTHFTIYDFGGNADYFNDPGYDPTKYRIGAASSEGKESREKYETKTADVPDFIIERGYIYVTPGQEKVDVKGYLIDFESRMRRMAEYSPILKRLKEGVEPSEEEIRELMVELNQDGYMITEDALKMVYSQPMAKMVDFIKHVLDIEKLPDREHRINEAFTNYIISNDYTPEQVRFLSLIKNTLLTKGSCTYEDFNKPPLKTEGGLDLGEKLFPHRFDNVFKELTKEVLA